MAKYKQLYIDLYKRNIFVFIGSHESFIKWVNDEFCEDEDYFEFIDFVNLSESKNAQGTFWYNASIGEGIIELNKFPKSPENIAVAAHECMHAVFHLLDFCGINYDKESSGESHTYLLEYLLSNLLTLKNYKTYDA